VSKDNLIEERIRACGPGWYRAAARTAAVSGVFCLVVVALLVVVWVRSLSFEPVHSADMAALRARFAKAEQRTEALVGEIRSLDLELRTAQARTAAFLGRGAWLLFCGLIVFVLSLRFAFTFKEPPPEPPAERAPPDAERTETGFARWAVAAAALLLVAAGLAGALTTPPPAAAPIEPVDKPPPKITLDRAKQWPRFRGPGGLGLSAYTNIPTRWDGAAGEGVLWQAPVPLPGQNSPVVWGDRIFLSGATKTEREVYCFDAGDGRLRWRAAVNDIPGSPLKPPKIIDDTGYAAPTMATDGERVYAIFANGDLVALDFDGRRAWATNLGPFDNHYGHASSLATWRDLLIVLVDQGPPLQPGESAKSALIAFDGATGRLMWRTSRPVPMAWGSPILIETGGRSQIVTCADPWVISNDPRTGAELWRAKCLEGEIGPSPAYARGTVFAAQEGAALAAIRAGGTGDVTDTHIAWQADDDLPDTVSPVSNGELVFTVAGVMVACFDAADGRLLWEQEFEHTFRSSPTIAGGRVYLMDVKGVMHIFKTARSFERVGTAPLGEDASTSPAFLDGRLYIRGEKHLFCIGSADARR